MTEKAKEWTAKRGQAKGIITRVATFADNINEQSKLSEVSSRLDLLERAFTDFKEADSKLTAMECSSEIIEIEAKYLSVKVKLKEFLAKAPTSGATMTDQFNQIMARTIEQQHDFLSKFSNSLSSSLNQSFLNQSSEEPHFTARLPRLHVPTFDGDYKDFQSFKDLFTASVSNKTYLSDAEKFQYLRSCLKGEPAELIKHFAISEANYQAAWAKICQRYDKKRIAISNFVTTFFEIPAVKERSAKKLRNLHNIADQVIRGLNVLGPEAESRDVWLMHILLMKTDPETQQAWALSTAGKDYPTFEAFLTFIENRCDGLEPCESIKSNHSKQPSARSHYVHSTDQKSSDTNIRPCPFCQQSHRLLECDKFLKLESQGKRNEVLKMNVCFNCLSTFHRVNRCQSRRSCIKCGRRHHSLLHDGISSNISNTSHSAVISQEVQPSKQIDNGQVTSNVSSIPKVTIPSAECLTIKGIPNITNSSNAVTSTLSSSTNVTASTVSNSNINLACTSYAILPTAVVKASDRFGHQHKCNILLDSGSQITFISDSCVKRLRLNRQRGNILVGGLATSNTSTKGKTIVEIRSTYDNSTKLTLNAFILDHITTTSDYEHTKIQSAERYQTLQLADPTYFRKKDIDILIGADYFFNILRHGQLIISPESPIAQETMFGWVISGQSQSISSDKTEILRNIHVAIQDDTTLETTLKRFWEQEEINIDTWNADENKCEEQFKATTKRNETGRLIVQLPFKDNAPELGDSYLAAKFRLHAMERKMASNPSFGRMYREFMAEYESLGHMTKLSSPDIGQLCDEVFYLPHHGIWKLNSETTKLRVVFDGSCKSTNGVSLNDKLLIGPTIQPTLWTVLLRFRKFPVALCADIEKMYRQVLVDSSQTKYQRILWRASNQQPVDHYELKTVTYGTSAASYLATRALLFIAEQNENKFPTVANAIKHNFYVDDLLTGAKDEREATKLKDNLKSVLNNYGFPLRKWKSNVQGLGDQLKSVSLSDQQHITHVLGLLWDPVKDVFHFNVNIAGITETECTKRSILSIISRIFDPLGWLSPWIIKTKLMMQYLWLAKVSWDEKIPNELENRWTEIKSEFETIKKIQIPRCIDPNLHGIEVHGFSDASELAYAACVYFRVFTKDTITSNLITSKSKVAPIQSVSLPRLELCGAHLLAKLIHKVCETFEFTIVPIYLWTDSTVVLSWLQSGPPRKWKVYVANRTAEIHKLVPNAIWRHVSSEDNPSDLATRGVKSSKLVSNDLWWKGPKWLYISAEPGPKPLDIQQTTKEQRLNVIGLQASATNNVSIIDELMDKFVKWNTLLRVFCIIQRYVFNLRHPQTKKSGHVTTEELNKSEVAIIRHVQQTDFASEIRHLKTDKQLKAKSALLALSPFIDNKGLLRVGGRLEHATCSYATKHPLIIPKGHKLSIILLSYLHKKHLHPGPALLVSLSRMKYWILGVRQAARSVCRKCITCFRNSHHTSTQLMGNLPCQRVIPARPFSKTGVDYAGPIMLATKRGRGSKLIKGYIVIFVCLCTKALHIEVAGDMTTATFMGALRRFASRRGVPNEILSDNGSNFRGANHLLTDIYRLFQSDEHHKMINQYVTDNNIKWSFIPPLSPNFGGIWERAVRSIKGHLVRVVGNSHLTYEEMSTVLAQIECILNSRPLCLISNEDPSNIEALTPAHFLTLGTAALIPDTNYTDIPISRLTRWQHVQQLIQSYWKRYSRDYLHTLQQRATAKYKQRNLLVNDIVLVMDDKNPPGCWPLGKVIDVHPGTDGVVRVATILSKQSIFKRPASKLCLVPTEDPDHGSNMLKPTVFNEGKYVRDRTSVEMS